MADEKRAKRVVELRAEFQRLLDFHEVSFRDIDAKAKYWLTITLPTFVALVGYLFKAGEGMELALQVAAYALAASLFVSTFLLSSVLRSRSVESGILKPPSHSFKDVKYFLESDDRWQELGEDQTTEMLRSIGANEGQNAVKSRWLRSGELSLLRGAPTAICLAGGSALLYSAACPDGFLAAAGICPSGPASGGIAAATGIAIGVGTSAVFVFADHFFTRYRSRSRL